MSNILIQISRLWKRQKRFFIVNIAGLSIGLAVSILLILYVFNEVSYDRYFKNKDRIVRLNSIWKEEGSEEFMPLCLRSAYTELPAQVTGIKSTLQIYRGWKVELAVENNRFQDLQLLYADTSFFSFFEFKSIYGDPVEALKNPNAAIITQSQAAKIFGSVNPVGKTFTLNKTLFTLGAVIEDIPENTHFDFDILAPMAAVEKLRYLGGLEFYTYYLLNDKSDKNKIISAIETIYKTSLASKFSDFKSSFDAKIEKLTDLHLFTKAEYDLSESGNFKTVMLLATLALLILILAITNFINLFLVQGESRASEIGVRKVNGANIKSLIVLFFSESASMVIMSFVAGFIIVGLMIPQFTSLIGHKIELTLLWSPLFIGSMVVLIILVIFLAGIYPALYLGRLNPVKIVGGGTAFRKQRVITGVVVFQSVITIFMLSVLVVIKQQITYLKNVPLHYNPENVMSVFYPSDLIKQHYKALQDKLKTYPEVEQVGGGQHIFGGGYSGQGIYRYGTSPDNNTSVNEYRVFPGTCEAFGLELKQGRFFTDGEKDKEAIILNETTVKKMGLTDPIGEKVVMFDSPLEIIGVVKDFYYETAAQKIEPLVLTNYSKGFYYMFVKFRKGTDHKQAALLTSKVFKEFDKDNVLNFKWCDEMVSAKYYREDMLSKTITWSTFLSIFIALLGLYAIHSYQMLQRTKEIGIRKVLGSKVSDIVYLTTSKSLKWFFLASLIGIPLAYIASNMWLQNYSNRIQPGILMFLVPIVLQALLSFIIVFVESLLNAKKNPIESLRYE